MELKAEIDRLNNVITDLRVENERLKSVIEQQNVEVPNLSFADVQEFVDQTTDAEKDDENNVNNDLGNDEIIVRDDEDNQVDENDETDQDLEASAIAYENDLRDEFFAYVENAIDNLAQPHQDIVKFCLQKGKERLDKNDLVIIDEPDELIKSYHQRITKYKFEGNAIELRNFIFRHYRMHHIQYFLSQSQGKKNIVLTYVLTKNAQCKNIKIVLLEGRLHNFASL